jgi:hypothetical protein
MMHITSGSRLKSIVPVLPNQTKIFGSIDKRGSAIYVSEREIERDEMTRLKHNGSDEVYQIPRYAHVD